MIEALNPSQRRALALGILLLIVAAIGAITVLPVWLVNAHYQSRVEELQQTLARLESIAEQDGALRSRYAEFQELSSSTGYFLTGESDAVAAAQVQEVLKEIAESNGTRLMSTQMLPARQSEESDAREIALRVRAQGSLPGIVQSIYDLETSQVLLFLDGLSLRTAPNRVSRFQPRGGQFEVNFDLVGYVSEVQ